MKYNEIRLRKGKVDDIAINNIHLEDMDGKVWWLGVYGKNGNRTTFWIKSKSKIEVEVVENELDSKFVEQEDNL